MKIIFLDIDGVLNWMGTEDRLDMFIGLDPENIAHFNEIIEAHPDSKIVMSSSWRHVSPNKTKFYSNFKELTALLHDRGLKGEFIGHTPIFFGYRGRGYEIRRWLDDNKFPGSEGDRFVILDDDDTGMESYVATPSKMRWESEEDYKERLAQPREIDLRPYHVTTSFYGYDSTPSEGGLREEHAKKAIQVLNGKLLPIKPSEE